MAGDITVSERAIRNEVEIKNLKDRILELKNDFEKYREDSKNDRKDERGFTISKGLLWTNALLAVFNMVALIVSLFKFLN